MAVLRLENEKGKACYYLSQHHFEPGEMAPEAYELS